MADVNPDPGDEQATILDYGHPAPPTARFVAWLRSRPWPSRRTWLAVLALAVCALLLWQSFEPWIVVHGVSGGYGTLDEKISKDGRLLITQSQHYGDPVVWDVLLGRRLWTLTVGSRVTWASFSADETRILGGNELGESFLWDATSGKLIAKIIPLPRFSDHSAHPRHAYFSPDGKRVVLLGTRQLDLYDAAYGARIARVIRETGVGETLQVRGPLLFSPDGKLFTVGVSGTTYEIFSTEDGRRLAELKSDVWNPNIPSMAFSPDGKALAAERYGFVHCWDVTTGAQRWPGVPYRGGGWTRMAFTPDSKRILLYRSKTNNTHDLSVVDALTGVTLSTTPIQGHTNRIFFSPDSTWGLRQLAGRGIESFDVTTNTRLGLAQNIGLPYAWQPISPDGTRLVVHGRSWNAPLVLLDRTLTQRSRLPPLGGYDGNYSDAVWAAGGKYLVTVTDQGVVRYWQLRRPEPLWGVIALWQFWLTVVALLLVLASYIGDFVTWSRRRTIAA